MALASRQAAKRPYHAEDCVAKHEWGQKRACPGCGSRFYDLMRDPITCPNCGARVDPTAYSKTRRSRTSMVKRVAATTAKTEVEVATTAEATTEPVESAAVADNEENENNIIEDASELGEDEDDVSEVVEGVEDSNVGDP